MIVFTLAVGVLIGTVVQTGVKAARPQSAAAPDATPLVLPPVAQMQGSFATVAKKLEPSVVNISVEFGGRTASPQARNGGGSGRRRVQPDDNGDDSGDSGGNSPEDLFRRFFGGGGGGIQVNPFGGEQMPSRATGSGVVVDKNGYILTNNHVVEKATKITVKFNKDDTDYPARVIGTDPLTDLAVIKIDRKDLVAAKIGNSDSMQVGDWAIAIGSPLGFQDTVTAGIISALSRDVDEPPTAGRTTKSTFQHFIQTDAAINPGNSGGPLVNTNGEVIGINTMIASESGGYQGIGFALPSNMAVKVYNNIIKEGKVTRGSIGITFPPEDSKTSALLDVYGAKQGVFVQDVVKDGPAERAGMKPQDVIVSINGKTIGKGQDLVDMVADSEIGSTLKIGIMRDKKPMTLNVVVADRAKTFAEGTVVSRNQDEKGSPAIVKAKFGISIGALSASAKQSLGYTGTGSVEIQEVEPGSFADGIGLEKGDILLELNREAINSPSDVTRIQSSLKVGDAVAFHVARQAGSNLRGSGGNWQPLYLAGRLTETAN
jgi:serine protease Do